MKPALLTERCVLLHGDSLQLAILGESTVDAVVCDPPYELGFMGKRWDAAGIAYNVDLWRAVLRVLKPGGHLLAFGGTRTYHRMTCAIEDAGFEIRDSLHWLYGCVPLETEILTAVGWRRYSQIAPGEQVVQVDAEGTASLGKLQAVSVYPFDGEMVQIETRSTLQLLTPGHTVHSYPVRVGPRPCRGMVEGSLEACTAEEFADSDLTGVVARRLPLAARTAETRHSFGSTDIAALYGWILAEGHYHRNVNAISIYQNEGRNADAISALLVRLGIEHSTYHRARTDYDGAVRPSVQFYLRVGSWCDRIRADMPGDKPTPPEWLAWLPDAEALALFEALVDGDGSRSGPDSGAWYQKRPEVRAWFQTLCFRLGYRSSEDTAKCAIAWCRSDSTEVQRGRHRKNATSRVPFTGEVWCPTVPQGRWVARYRGHVFVTGNTGFPKSLNVSKAIDETLGADRVIEYREGAAQCVYLAAGKRCEGHGDERTLNRQYHQPPSSAASPEAAAWEGWGTALKPGHEPIVLARKPLISTVAKNILTHGTGGLNIDACRIGNDNGGGQTCVYLKAGEACQGHENTRAQSGKTFHRSREGEASAERRYTENGGTNFAATPGPRGGDPAGRWPANVVLSHAPECATCGWCGKQPGEQCRNCNGTAFLSCSAGCPVASLDEQSGVLAGRGNKGPSVSCSPSVAMGAPTAHSAGSEFNYDSGGGASRFFYVAKPNRRERDAGCDHLPAKSGGEATDRVDGSAGTQNPRAGAGRTGGARNHHPTVKPVALMRYLVRLITPPGGVVLDPFAGSGTTGVAAIAEGFSFIGVEGDFENAGYLAIAEARLRHALKGVE